jgi:hypothetical protein
MAGPGNASGTVTSKPILFVRSVIRTERLKLLKKFTTSSLSLKVVAMKPVT